MNIKKLTRDLKTALAMVGGDYDIIDFSRVCEINLIRIEYSCLTESEDSVNIIHLYFSNGEGEEIQVSLSIPTSNYFHIIAEAEAIISVFGRYGFKALKF